ncbi:MAG: hypothetical protein RJA07_1315 [Bacteroidota bacterium]|jgi:hypothetical protein
MSAPHPILSEKFYAPDWELLRKKGLRLFAEIDSNNFYLSGALEHDAAPIFFEHYSLNKIESFLNADMIKAVRNQLNWLNEVAISKFTICFQNIPFQLLPEDFAPPHATDNWQSIDTINSIEGKIVYEISSNINLALQSFCSNIILKHSLTGLMHQVVQLMLTNDDAILCNINSNSFNIILWQNKKVKMLNTYAINTPEDMVYFLQLAVQQHKMIQPKLLVGGEIVQQSLYYTTISKFFQHLEIISRLAMKQQGVFKTLLPNRFLTLSGIIACE